MADVMSAFLQGHQAGQAEQQHEQQLEENKLRMLVLKHQIDGLKIEDQLRTREIEKQNFDLLHGQPEADIPSDQVTTQQPNLPATNLAGMMTGLIRDRQAQGLTPPDAAATTLGQEPTSIGAPGAQASQPGTHPETNRVARPMTISGVPGLGVEGVSVRPKSAEDLIRTMITTELAKPYTLNEGAKRFVGGREVASGGSKPVVVPAGGNLVNPDAPAGTPPIATGGAGNSEFAQFQPIYAEGLGATSFAKLTSAQKAGAIPAFTKMKQDPALAGMRLDAEQMRHAAADARDEQTQFTNDFRRYTGEVAQQTKAHNEAMKLWQKAADSADHGVDLRTGKPLADAPEFAPQTFDEWRAEHPAPEKKTPGKGGKPAAAPAAGAPKEGDTKEIPGHPGSEQTFKNGKWIRTK